MPTPRHAAEHRPLDGGTHRPDTRRLVWGERRAGAGSACGSTIANANILAGCRPSRCRGPGGTPAVAKFAGPLSGICPDWQDYPQAATLRQRTGRAGAGHRARDNAPRASSCGRLFDAVLAPWIARRRVELKAKRPVGWRRWPPAAPASATRLRCRGATTRWSDLLAAMAELAGDSGAESSAFHDARLWTGGDGRDCATVRGIDDGLQRRVLHRLLAARLTFIWRILLCCLHSSCRPATAHRLWSGGDRRRPRAGSRNTTMIMTVYASSRAAGLVL